MEAKKIVVRWVSRHDLSPAQVKALRALHGEDVEIIKDPVVFDDVGGLRDYIDATDETREFVYAVAGCLHYVAAALAGCTFGLFTNYAARRADGSFGLHQVFHVYRGGLIKVWVNPNPMSDEGERLDAPVLRPAP